ncbi:very-long-chain aldehyde decarbonylase CER1-like isoform X2 [Hibiscus syriacus]|uniref:very-long-chain aldehyde decarbonylase CER1-like isoform X2 n=1 Tax=Hibiscus syriacus TaxID=106335 RepID=UPI001920B982|nr:very-long-chain aldehyde decarbonylase CER1-like isoform X2 [Hibiscus syriacus]
MASKPGILTDWPWKPLGSFKYMVLCPWIAESMYSIIVKEWDAVNLMILPLMLWRALQNQLWITLSRYRTAIGTNRIVDKSIEFDQVDRESNWDDQILFNAILFYLVNKYIPGASHLPMWRTDGVVITILVHACAVEFLYYWLHRALHHHYLYSRYHSHHHSSIATEPITSVIHPFAEHIAYYALFAIPGLTTVLTGTASLVSIAGYSTYIDFMNNMGHCNFELIPNWVFSIFPPLKYLMYTPSFHSLHHTQFRTNYSLFMPIYDYMYDTRDKTSDSLYENSLKRKEESPNVVHLTHLITPESIYHLRLGFASFASKPYSSAWYLWLLWPVTLWSMMLTWIYGRTFVVERNRFDKLKLQTWAIPKYKLQYRLKGQKESIKNLIEEAVLEADEKGASVLSLGLMNQSEELNKYGEVYVKKHPKLKMRLVDGSSLAVAVLLNSIPKGTTQLLFTGKLTKVAVAVAFALCKKGIQVSVSREDEHEKLDKSFGFEGKLVMSKNYSSYKIWLVGDEMTEEEQRKAAKGTLLIPFSQFPPQRLRKDCFYHTTPAMQTPRALENVDSCENWLPRRVMSVSRIAGIVHGLEGWEEHECGSTISNIDKVWEASLKHGFQPLRIPALSKS